MPESVIVTKEAPLLEVRIDRPKANAIDTVTSRLMGEAFAEFRDDPGLRVAILTGAGDRFFSAGWDLPAAVAGEEFEDEFGIGGFGGFRDLAGLRKPVIAAVNGIAAGGGFEIALDADLIIAAEHAEFLLPEVNIGLMADAGSIQLPRKLPHALAVELLLTGRRMPADEALRWGLINAVVPADELQSKARELAATIARAAPLGVEATLDVLKHTRHLDVEQAYQVLRSLPSYQKMLASEDAQEGPRAFTEKRPPQWKGR